jgi:hypothetical protein
MAGNLVCPSKAVNHEIGRNPVAVASWRARD